jgi:phi13 family phage major tail protein
MPEAKNKVKFGLSNVHIAKITEQDGQITYGTPIALPGAVSLTADPEGDTTPFYADNIKYYIAVANNGYTGELEIAMTPEEFLTEILGQEKDTNGALIESSDDINARFALMGEIEGDVKKRRFVYFDVTAARPSSEMNTVEESKEPQTDTLELTMAARSTDNAIKAVIEPNETNQDVYDTFFKKVYEKNAVAGV